MAEVIPDALAEHPVLIGEHKHHGHHPLLCATRPRFERVISEIPGMVRLRQAQLSAQVLVLADVVDLHVLDGLAQMLLFETKQSKPAHDHVPHSTGTLSARSGPVAVVVTRHSHTNTLA